MERPEGKTDDTLGIFYGANDVMKTHKEAEQPLESDEDKLAYALADFAYDEVPDDALDEVKERVAELRGN